MPIEAPQISLRGRTWGGRDSRSPIGPGLSRLVNAYVSSDGQEIRRIPGFKCVIDPGKFNPDWESLFPKSYRLSSVISGTAVLHGAVIRKKRLHGFAQVRNRTIFYGEADFTKQYVGRAADDTIPVQIVSWTSGGPGIGFITLDFAPKAYGNPFGLGRGHFSGSNHEGDYVYIEGTGNPELDNRFHKISAAGDPTTNVLFASTTLTTSDTVATPANTRLYRVRRGNIGADAYSLEEPDSLAIWTLRTLPDVVTPSVPDLVAQIASRNPDYGDDPTYSYGWTDGLGGTSRRKSTTIPRRLNPDVSGDRLLLACPGRGVVYQCPVITPPGGGWLPSPDESNYIYDQPRALGVPKAVLFDPDFKDPLKPAESGTIEGPGDGQFFVQVAYKDDGTGEIGRASEPATYSLTNQTLRIAVLHPAYLMGETGATSIVVYITGPGGSITGQYRIHGYDSESFWSPSATQSWRYGRRPKPIGGGTYLLQGNTFSDLFCILDVYIDTAVWGRSFNADYDIDFNRIPDDLRQMPMGCKVVRTIRGITLFGGYEGNHGEALQLQSALASALFVLPEPSPRQNRNGRSEQELAQQLFNYQTAAAADGGFGIGAGAIPPAYEGQELRSNGAGTENLYDDNIDSIRIDKLVNQYAGWNDAGMFYWPAESIMLRYQMAGKIHRNAKDKRGKSVHLVMPRGTIQWSEAGQPGVVPAINTATIDSEQDQDVEGIGRHGNMAVICTARQTHAMSWDRGPLGASPRLVDPTIGCIAPNAMVDFDGGLAWIGDLGPVVMRGGPPQWARQFERDFSGVGARYLKDGRGMMRHAWGAHDRTRALLFFGLRVSDEGDTVLELKANGSSGDPKTWAEANDDLRSKFPCDEVLVYSYRQDAWSVWVPHKSIQWMGELRCSDGQVRMCFMHQDGRTFALDDAWGAGWDRYTTAVADVAGTNSTTFSTGAATFQTTPQLGFVEADMSFVIYSPSNGAPGSPGRGIRAYGTIDSVDSTTEVTLSTPCTWAAGDVIVIGPPEMLIESRYWNSDDLVDEHTVGGVSLSYTLDNYGVATGGYLAGEPGPLETSWVAVSVESEEGEVPFDESGVSKAGTVTFQRDRLLESPSRRFLSRTVRTAKGRSRAFNSRVKIVLRGAAQPRIHDIRTEVAK